tara:strand:+ start:2753 stop:5749 length:2997 start_codon:yes stop_codon:yes gene_type:complete
MTEQSLLARSIKTILMAGVGSVFLAGAPAFAQDANQDVDVQGVQTTDEQESSAEEQPERIQVTGSRIRTDAFANETPVDIISIEEAEQQGLNTLGELLRTSTVAAGSSQITAAFATGYVVNGGAGAETISMRGLGANRTLVLLNGRRAGPAGTRGAVSAFDMNALPISAIERVEVLKDGASSLYGSDAVAGVINIITKTDDSKTFSVDLSQPFESGGERQRINASWGESFDKGSYRFVADYNVQQELLRGDRDFYACRERLLFNEDGTRGDPIDPRTGEYHCNDTGFGLWLYNAGAGNVPSGAKAFYDYDGFLAANGYDSINDTYSAPGDLRGPEGWYMGAYDRETDPLWNLAHPFRDKVTMIPETKTLSLFLQGDYQLTDTITAYSELLHSSRETTTQGYRQFWTGDVGAQPASLFGFEGNAYMMPVALTDHYGSDVEVDYSRFVAGLEGSIGFWDWDISYQNSYNKGLYGNKIIYRDSMLMAQNHLVNGTSCNGETTPISGLTCTDVNFADPNQINGNPTQAVRDFLFGYEQGETIYKQQTLEAYITGDLFTLPAGPVGSAFGVSYQRDEIDDTPGEVSAQSNSWGLSSASRTAGSQNSKAVFGEVRLPVLADVTMAQRVDLTGSFRWTDVSTYGSDSTFKLGLNWEINDDWRVRASRGTSFRSPALFELYLAGQTAFPGQMGVDPCYNYGQRYEEGNVTETVYQNCLADGVPTSYDGSGTSSVTEYTSGGGDTLRAETSVAESAGIVWTSPEDTFAASIDYYDIQISGQVSKLTASDIVGTCYRSEDFPNDPLCDLFSRNNGDNGDWGIDEVQAGYVNVASQGVRGVDINLTYQDDFDFGSIRVALEHTNQISHTYQLFSDSVERQYIGEIGEPKHVGQLFTTFSRDDWSVTWTMRYVDRVSDIPYWFDGSNETQYRGETYEFIGHIPTTVYHTLSGNVNLLEGLDLTVGVGNIFDKEPPKVSPTAGVATTGNAAIYSQYDQLGRRVFANLTYNF